MAVAAVAFMPRRVLSVSYDLALLKTREMILERQGYAVYSVHTLDDAIQAARNECFDVAIIGHSIPVEDQRQIATMIRQNRAAPFVVALTSREREATPYADRAWNAHEPEEMVAELKRMFSDVG